MSLVFLDTKLSQKFQEALPLSVAKEYTKLGGDYQNRLSDWFVKGDGVTKIGKKNHRLYIPVKRVDKEDIPSSEIEIEVKAFIDEKSKGGFDEIDYKNGYIFPKGKKDPVKIGKTLNKLGANFGLLQKYNDDPVRIRKGKKSPKLLAVISRHPVDIAGMSSDRNWDSCKNLGTKKIVYANTKKIASEGQFAYKIKTEIDKLLVAYLVKDDDLNIRYPIGRINIIPYYKGDSIFYRADTEVKYHAQSLNEANSVEFVKTVQKWLKIKQKETPMGVYEWDDDVHNDGIPDTIYRGTDSSELIPGTKFRWNEFELDIKQRKIQQGLEDELDVKWYANPKFSIWQMKVIEEGLENGVDVSIYADLKYDSFEMGQIKDGLENGVDVSIYADIKYDHQQMREIRDGLENGVDVSIYADIKYEWDQMEQIKEGLEQDLNASIYANPEFNSDQMKLIKQGLEDELDVKWYANPKFNQWQMEQIIEGLEDELDVSQYADPKYNYIKMNEIKKTLKK